MEETKKRRGYKTQAQQTEATKRYRNTENGKARIKYSNSKSTAKKFIKEMATISDLKEIKNLIEEKIKEEIMKKHFIIREEKGKLIPLFEGTLEDAKRDFQIENDEIETFNDFLINNGFGEIPVKEVTEEEFREIEKEYFMR